VLLAKLKTGGMLAGLPLAAGRAVVISEESPGHWYRRGQKLHFGDHVCWFCRPFDHRPRPDEWVALLDYIAGLRDRYGLDLVVIDPLASFLPGRDENNAGLMLEALLPLQRLTAAGLAVLVLHHPRKGEPSAGQMARGSGALSGYVDVLIEMTAVGPPASDDRRRRLRAWSRHEETPRSRVIELTADGRDYLVGEEPEGQIDWKVVSLILRAADRKLSRREILTAWPADPKPDDVTLYRWLERAVAEGKLQRDGHGRRGRPFRYGLPEATEKG
jgi:AAA domain